MSLIRSGLINTADLCKQPTFILLFSVQNKHIYNIMTYRNSWTLDARVGRWTLDAGLWTLDSGRWTLDAGL